MSQFFRIALIVLVLGCASPSPSPTRTTSGASPDVAAPAGKWRGYYRQVPAGDMSLIHGDIELPINDNGIYAGTWSNRQVAGSTRASRTDIAGTVVVILRDWRDPHARR